MTKQIITIFLAIILNLSFNEVIYAQNNLKSSLDKLITSSSLNKTSIIAVSVRDIQSSKVIYERFGNQYLHTASILKALTTPVAFYYLGVNYKISTVLANSAENNNIYLKLSGDPLLTGNELVNLFNKARNNGLNTINGNLIIDAHLIDDIPWGVGWLWDDENSPLMPKYNAFNIDHNLIKVKVSPTVNNTPPIVSLEPNCNFKIVNTAITSNINTLSVERKPWLSTEDIFVSGKINRPVQRTIPVGNNEKYFLCKLTNSLDANNIKLNGNIITGSYPVKANVLDSIDHNLADLIAHTNQQSDNLAAETLLKITGSKYSNTIGTTQNGLSALKYFYTKIGADPKQQVIVDGSGASHNNLIQPNWISLALSKLYHQPFFDIYRDSLSQPCGKGTLSYRMKNLKGNLWGKTGTLSGISGVAGYLKAKSGKMYAVVVLIQNFTGPKAPVKSIENKIIETIYNY